MESTHPNLRSHREMNTEARGTHHGHPSSSSSMPCRADFISNKTYSTSHSFATCHSKYRALCIQELDEVCIDWPCAQCMMSRSTSTCAAFTPSFHVPRRRPHFHQQTSTSSRSCSQPRLKRCGSIRSPNYLLEPMLLPSMPYGESMPEYVILEPMLTIRSR